MDNNKSFSLQFNPLTNVKCVKDYEDEITTLKAENFELKAQLTHSNIPKVLYENKQEMENLLFQKQELQNALENMKNTYENLNKNYSALQQENKLLENKYNKDLVVAEEKYGFVEDENKRILLRLEKLNKEVQESILIKSELNNYKEMIQNLERQSEQQRYLYEKQLEEFKIEMENYNKKVEAEMNQKNYDYENLKKKYEQVVQKERNDSFIITDLKATLNGQIKDKKVLDEMIIKNSNLEHIVKEKEELIDKIIRDNKTYYNGMEKFKSIISKKLNDITYDLQNTTEKMIRLKEICYISDENCKLLKKLNVKYNNFNEIILFFKDKHSEAHRKIEILKKEASDAVYFASNTKNNIEKKTAGFIQDFKEQFNEAKNELLVCRKYLEKKAQENKMLKTENGRLQSEVLIRAKQMEALKKFTMV